MIEHYRMPESFNAFCNIVSLTAANTSRIFVVSVACVKLNRTSEQYERERKSDHTEDIH